MAVQCFIKCAVCSVVCSTDRHLQVLREELAELLPKLGAKSTEEEVRAVH